MLTIHAMNNCYLIRRQAISYIIVLKAQLIPSKITASVRSVPLAPDCANRKSLFYMYNGIVQFTITPMCSNSSFLCERYVLLNSRAQLCQLLCPQAAVVNGTGNGACPQQDALDAQVNLIKSETLNLLDNTVIPILSCPCSAPGETWTKKFSPRHDAGQQCPVSPRARPFT